MKLLCWFKFHKWNYNLNPGIERVCSRCNKRQIRTVKLNGSGSEKDNIEKWK